MNKDKPITKKENIKKEKTNKENKDNKKGFPISYWFLCVAILVFAVYSTVTIVDIYSQIREKQNELDSINDEITVQEIKNEEMSKIYNYSDEEFSQYIEQIAREDLDYVKDGERVFVNFAGD